MSLILCIDTAGENGTVAICQNETIVEIRQNDHQQEHASFVQPAIDEMMKKQGVRFADLSAVAVSNGPGSYTGLRVGLASAKGICFAQSLPLITLSSLEVLAEAMKRIISKTESEQHYLICPMIDARRMEVFMALYDEKMKSVLQPSAAILEFGMFNAYKQEIYFAGSGAAKWLNLCAAPLCKGLQQPPDIPAALARLANSYFERHVFADLAYSVPFYCKDFYTPKSAG